MALPESGNLCPELDEFDNVRSTDDFAIFLARYLFHKAREVAKKQTRFRLMQAWPDLYRSITDQLRTRAPDSVVNPSFFERLKENQEDMTASFCRAVVRSAPGMSQDELLDIRRITSLWMTYLVIRTRSLTQRALDEAHTLTRKSSFAA